MSTTSKVRSIALLALLGRALTAPQSVAALGVCDSGDCFSCETEPGLCLASWGTNCEQWAECDHDQEILCGGPGGTHHTVCECGVCS